MKNTISIALPILLVFSGNACLGSILFSKGETDSKQLFNMPIISQVSKDTDVRNVTVVGRGESFDKAAQNAAKNALTEVVGTFLDSKTLVNKKTVIDDGLVERTKEIRVDISEYSQGSIQSLKIIDAYQENNLAIVIAKVRVRIDDFRSR